VSSVRERETKDEKTWRRDEFSPRMDDTVGQVDSRSSIMRTEAQQTDMKREENEDLYSAVRCQQIGKHCLVCFIFVRLLRKAIKLALSLVSALHLCLFHCEKT